MGFSWILIWNIVEKGTIVLMRSLCKYSLLELQKKNVWLMDALGIIKKKKLLSFIFIVFSKNAKIIGESLHDYLWYFKHEMKQTIKPMFIFKLISWDTL